MKCINCGAELGNVTVSMECPYCGTINTPYTIDPLTSDKEEMELIFEKPVMPESEFRGLCKRKLSVIPTLPLDFFTQVKVVSCETIEGVVGVVRDMHKVGWTEVQGDQHKSMSDNLAVTFAVPTPEALNSFPDVYLEYLKLPSTVDWFSTKLNRSARIPKSMAATFKRTYQYSLPADRKAGLVKLLTPEIQKRIKAPWHLMNDRIFMEGSFPGEELFLCKIYLNALKWQYKGQEGTIYSDPVHKRIIHKGLPVDKELKSKLEKSKKKKDLLFNLSMIIGLILVVVVFFIWLKTPLRWYWALLIQFGIFILFAIISGLGLAEDPQKEQFRKKRLSGPSNI